MGKVTTMLTPIATLQPCALIDISNIHDGAGHVRSLKETYGDTVHAVVCDQENSHLLCVVRETTGQSAVDLAYNIVCRVLRYPPPKIAKPIGSHVAMAWLEKCDDHQDLVAFLRAATN